MSHEFTTPLAANGVRQWLSRTRQCWDNAIGEGFFGTLKTELVYRQPWPTRSSARRADVAASQPSPSCPKRVIEQTTAPRLSLQTDLPALRGPRPCKTVRPQ